MGRPNGTDVRASADAPVPEETDGASFELLLMLVSVLVSVGGIGVAVFFFLARREAAARAVGLEAWSRGAGVVTLVESDRRTCRLIGQNAQVLGFAKANVICTDVSQALTTPPIAPYDPLLPDPARSLAPPSASHPLSSSPAST